MKKFLVLTTSVFGLLAAQNLAARADAALDLLAKDPKQWVMQQGDNANTRYSKLNQINAANAGKLQANGAGSHVDLSSSTVRGGTLATSGVRRHPPRRVV